MTDQTSDNQASAAAQEPAKTAAPGKAAPDSKTSSTGSEESETQKRAKAHADKAQNDDG